MVEETDMKPAVLGSKMPSVKLKRRFSEKTKMGGVHWISQCFKKAEQRQ